jgi:dolichyl-phosphate beta-glucosyltransferase
LNAAPHSQKSKHEHRGVARTHLQKQYTVPISFVSRTFSFESSNAANGVVLSVIVPMFCEARRIRSTLEELADVLPQGPSSAEVVLVDDGSTDGTVGVVRPFLTDHAVGLLRRVRLVQHRTNRGKGAAVRTGLGTSLGAWRLIMDADSSCRIMEVSKLLDRRAPGVGMVCGSRLAIGSEVTATIVRRLTGASFQLALRTMGLNLVQDTQCGFKLYRGDLAEQVVIHSREDGYAFDIEHLLIANAAALRAVEVGVRWAHQNGSRVRPVRDGFRMLVAADRIRRRWSQSGAAVAKLPPLQSLEAVVTELKPAADVAEPLPL